MSAAQAKPQKAKGYTYAKVTDNTIIKFKAPRPKKGPKTELLSLVPRKGSITLKALTAKAEGIKPARGTCNRWRGMGMSN
ncbi:MAG TPA: hypothetical protein VME42_11415 [Steroidobacteraceae bacterium]|nr:hypothetical protein [Steroidobacteraceae bacterium]